MLQERLLWKDWKKTMPVFTKKFLVGVLSAPSGVRKLAEYNTTGSTRDFENCASCINSCCVLQYTMTRS